MNPWGVYVPPPTEAEFFNAARPTTFMIVEGGSDERFWVSRVDPRFCKVRAVGGRGRALQEIKAMLEEGRAGVVAVLDADFDRIDGVLQEQSNVVWTDLHDLELILVTSPALEKVLAEVGSTGKRDKFELGGKTLRDAIVEGGASVARLRWFSKRESLNLKFRKLQPGGHFKFLAYEKFCDRKSLRVDSRLLVRTVLNFSSRQDLDEGEILDRVMDMPDVDVWQLCVGHDVVGVLSVALRSCVGSRNFGVEELQERLRLAFEKSHLESTFMYRALCAWERENSPFRIFPEEGARRFGVDEKGSRVVSH